MEESLVKLAPTLISLDLNVAGLSGKILPYLLILKNLKFLKK